MNNVDGLCWLIIGELLTITSYILNALLDMFCLLKCLHDVQLIIIIIIIVIIIIIYKLITGTSRPGVKW
jgi:hypothetical protein